MLHILDKEFTLNSEGLKKTISKSFLEQNQTDPQKLVLPLDFLFAYSAFSSAGRALVFETLDVGSNPTKCNKIYIKLASLVWSNFWSRKKSTKLKSFDITFLSKRPNLYGNYFQKTFLYK